MPRNIRSIKLFGFSLVVSSVIYSMVFCIGRMSEAHQLDLNSIMDCAIPVLFAVPGIFIGVLVLREKAWGLLLGLLFCTLQIAVYYSDIFDYNFTIGIVGYYIKTAIPGLKINVIMVAILLLGIISLNECIASITQKRTKNLMRKLHGALLSIEVLVCFCSPIVLWLVGMNIVLPNVIDSVLTGSSRHLDELTIFLLVLAVFGGAGTCGVLQLYCNAVFGFKFFGGLKIPIVCGAVGVFALSYVVVAINTGISSSIIILSFGCFAHLVWLNRIASASNGA